MKPVWFSVALVSAAMALPAVAVDAGNGRSLAQARCAACHIVAPGARAEVADSPPFETIGRKFSFDAERIATAILAPHPKMNLTLTRSEARDIAAHIGSLAR